MAHIRALAPELDEFTAERLARRLAGRLGNQHERPVDARAVADFLGLQKTDWVYAHAAELGGFRLGTGQKARWRFLLSEIPARLRALHNSGSLAAVDEKPARSKPRTRRRAAEEGTTPRGAPLLKFSSA